MTDQLVKDNERIDDLQNGYYVIQDPDKFCFGMDAVPTDLPLKTALLPTS